MYRTHTTRSVDLYQIPTASTQLSKYYIHTEPAKFSFCNGIITTLSLAAISRKHAYYKDQKSVSVSVKVTSRRVRAIIVAVQKHEILHIPSLCL
jgi:hypothetical protein